MLRANSAFAPPIGFYYNQGDIEFDQLKSENFLLYHDRRAPHEAKFYMNALENARPHLESWLGIKRSSPLIVNMSATSDHASFANFIFDNIELQTFGQGPRDLAWHEYTHSTMYRHLDNLFGPAGAIIHLPWMPAWFLEGFAEAFSVSVGSDVQSGIERYHALTGDWPSYDRLHSLYSNYNFALRGYATSGAFVTYLLRQLKSEDLPKFLEDFYWKSMPWTWPGTVVPFLDFMPMDSVFKKYFNGKNGSELYAEYKDKATAHWKSVAKESFFLSKPSQSLPFENYPRLKINKDKVYDLINIDNELMQQEINFDSNGWAQNRGQSEKIVEEIYGATALDTSVGKVFFSSTSVDTSGNRTPTLVIQNSETQKTFPLNATYAYGLNQSEYDIFWIEGQFEKTRFCYISKDQLIKSGFNPNCKKEFTVPASIEYLGVKTKNSFAEKIYFNLRQQTLSGDIHQIIEFNTADKQFRNFGANMHSAPLQMAFAGETTLALVSGHSSRALRKLDATGECRGQLNLSDFIVGISTSESSIFFSLYGGKDFFLKKSLLSSLQFESCSSIGSHTSPLIEALRAEKPISASEAFERSSTWSTPKEFRQQKISEKNSQTSSEPYSWKGKSAFAFPWIGAEDALGPQIGVVSVPLVDHLQNEMVRVTLLAGVYSRYPYQEISLVSTRFKPTYTFSLFRNQTYNGRQYNTEKDEVTNSFLDEKGGRIDSSYRFLFSSSTLQLTYGVKISNLKPYIGEKVRSGNLNEPYAGIGYDFTKKNMTFSNLLRTRLTPRTMNSDFEYDVLGASTGVSFYFKRFLSTFETGLEGSRTRGPKRRDLQEVYFPLKTFVPGSGGGYNKNSFPFIGAGSLFSPRFGDTQARYRANYTHPIVSDFEKHFWILYIDRLDFSTFYNYGGAWFEGDKNIKRNFISSHGYNLDLQFDNKGVRFNLGLGTGQVVGDPFQLYITSGFDALF